MTARRLRYVVCTLSVALLCTAGAGARAQQVEQVLERQAVWTPGAALELDLLESGATGPDISNYGVTPESSFSVCHDVSTPRSTSAAAIVWGFSISRPAASSSPSLR